MASWFSAGVHADLYVARLWGRCMCESETYLDLYDAYGWVQTNRPVGILYRAWIVLCQLFDPGPKTQQSTHELAFGTPLQVCYHRTLPAVPELGRHKRGPMTMTSNITILSKFCLTTWASGHRTCDSLVPIHLALYGPRSALALSWATRRSGFRTVYA